MEEEVADEDGGDDACKVCKESTDNSMSGLANTYATEIDCEDVESGVGTALEYTREASHERIGPEIGPGIDHHTTSTTTAEGFHECCRKGCYEIGIDATKTYQPCDAVDEEIHRTRCTEYGDSYEDGNEVWDDFHGRLESVFGSLDEGIVDINLLEYTCEDEDDDDGTQKDVGKEGGDRVHGLG